MAITGSDYKTALNPNCCWGTGLMVHWEQRGTAKSYSNAMENEKLSLDDIHTSFWYNCFFNSD